MLHFKGMTTPFESPFRGRHRDSEKSLVTKSPSHDVRSIIQEISLKGTAFLILFWLLAEMALLLGNSAADRSAQVAIQYTPPNIEIAEYPEEPNLSRLIATRVLASKAAPQE